MGTQAIPLSSRIGTFDYRYVNSASQWVEDYANRTSLVAARGERGYRVLLRDGGRALHRAHNLPSTAYVNAIDDQTGDMR
jgi:hypothetical protein